MFSNNHQISMRQVFRLFTYDLIGMSTLLLPGLLAGEAGVDGVFAILAGTEKSGRNLTEELKEKENLSDKGEEAEDESGGN